MSNLKKELAKLLYQLRTGKCPDCELELSKIINRDSSGGGKNE